MKLSPRRASREFAMQGVYQWLFTGATPATVLTNLSELEGFDRADADFLLAVVDEAVGAV